MTEYQIVIPKKVVKQLNKIPLLHRGKIRKVIAALAADPLLGKKLEGRLSKQRSIRVWPYRIIYTIFEKQVTILILSVSHRQGSYK